MRIKNIFLYNESKKKSKGIKKNLDRNEKKKKKTQNTKTAKVVLTFYIYI